MLITKRRCVLLGFGIVLALQLPTMLQRSKDHIITKLNSLNEFREETMRKFQELAKNAHKDPVKLVLILTYNRCGSSFLGNILNSNPEAFYVYEPLDAALMHLYGTKLGWNIFSDYMYFRNKTRRELTEEETNAMVKTITEFFTCDTENMYPEVLFSNFWNRFGEYLDLGPWKRCLWTRDVSPRHCHNRTNNACGVTFDAETTYRKCHDQLAGKAPTISPEIQNYKACMADVVSRGEPCVPLLAGRCQAASLRGVKTVRAPMQVAEILLERHPNLKVIHLVRDPRPVAYSRRTHESFRATYPLTYDMTHEGTLVCDAMLRDIRRRLELQRLFPGRVTSIVFEEFARQPINETRRIYRFLGEPEVPRNTTTWLHENSKASLDIAFKWTTLLDRSAWDAIRYDPMCRDLYDLMRDYWTADYVGGEGDGS